MRVIIQKMVLPKMVNLLVSQPQKQSVVSQIKVVEKTNTPTIKDAIEVLLDERGDQSHLRAASVLGVVHQKVNLFREKEVQNLLNPLKIMFSLIKSESDLSKVSVLIDEFLNVCSQVQPKFSQSITIEEILEELGTSFEDLISLEVPYYLRMVFHPSALGFEAKQQVPPNQNVRLYEKKLLIKQCRVCEKTYEIQYKEKEIVSIVRSSKSQKKVEKLDKLEPSSRMIIYHDAPYGQQPYFLFLDDSCEFVSLKKETDRLPVCSTNMQAKIIKTESGYEIIPLFEDGTFSQDVMILHRGGYLESKLLFEEEQAQKELVRIQQIECVRNAKKVQFAFLFDRICHEDSYGEETSSVLVVFCKNKNQTEVFALEYFPSQTNSEDSDLVILYPNQTDQSQVGYEQMIA